MTLLMGIVPWQGWLEDWDFLVPSPSPSPCILSLQWVCQTCKRAVQGFQREDTEGIRPVKISSHPDMSLKFRISSSKSRLLLHQTKRQPIEWEKIFVSHIPHKELISKMYKEFTQLNSICKSKQKLIKKWAMGLNRHFPKKTYKWPRGTWKGAKHYQL